MNGSKPLKQIISFLLAFVMILSSMVAIAENISFDTLSNEELIALQEKISNEIRIRKILDDTSAPVWNGQDKIVVYDDNDVTITFNGLHNWTSSLYIPKLMITNKSSKDIYFTWDEVYFDNSPVKATNGGSYIIPANGKLAFHTTNRCAIDIEKYIEAYDETLLHEMKMDFVLSEVESSWDWTDKNTKRESLRVKCEINLTAIDK